MQTTNNKIRVASLFCGCGGSDLGTLGGFTFLDKEYYRLPTEIVYAIDFDPKAVQTYNSNFEHPAVCDDVCNVDFEKIPDLDLLIGGFPCQSFSTVNPTKDTNDARANLYKQIVRALHCKHPQAFICENVKGLMTLQKGEIIKRIIGEFEEEGYNVTYKLVRAVDFGIPQRRERVIIVGIRKDIDYTYLYPIAQYQEGRYVPLKSVIDSLEIDEKKYYFSEKAVVGMKNAKNNMKRGLWQDLDLPCLTITSHLAKTSINSRDPVLLVDAEREIYRRFTPREAARIQSFPDDFVFPVSDHFAYKQIGNAVPPVLMWNIINSIVGMYGKFEGYQISERIKPKKYKQLDFQWALEQYPESIVENSKQEETVKVDGSGVECLEDRNLLVSMVKNDTIDQLLDGSINIYYTGKRFPSTVALNHLYYFMPYRKGKGIRDLYFIKIARVGSKHEVHPDADPNDLRLVFEIEFVKQLFPDYKPIDLEIWHTFTDTTLHNILSM